MKVVILEALLMFGRCRVLIAKNILPFKKELLSCRNLVEAKQKFYGSVLGRMKESKEIDKLRIPTSTGISANERASKLAEAGKKPIAKESPITRMRAKGWK